MASHYRRSASQGQKKSFREMAWGYYFRHYAGLVWRKKWFVLSIAPLVMGAWIVYLLKFGGIRPELEAEVILGIENTENASPVQGAGTAGFGKIELLKSRAFLREVVDELGLRLMTGDRPRSSLFDSVAVDTQAVNGKYELDIHGVKRQFYVLVLSNEELGLDKKVLDSGSVASLDTLYLPGLTAVFSQKYLQKPQDISFSVVDQKNAVDWIVNNVTIDRSTLTQGFTRVTFAGRDYDLITRVLNTMVDDFVQRNLRFRKRKTEEMLVILDKQLESATGQLENAEQRLKNYRQGNPTVGMGEIASETVSDAMSLDVENVQTTMTIDDAKRLAGQLKSGGQQEKPLIIRQVISFLDAHGVGAAAAMSADYAQISERLNELELQYPDRHPIIREQKDRIVQLGKKASGALDEFIEKQQRIINNNQNRVAQITGRLRGLPRKEMRLAELNRQREIAAEIHSTLQTRYNQARIANVVEVPDVYVMDYALPPQPPPDSVTLLLKLMLGAFLGLVAGFGPVVLMDFTDKTARSEPELMHLINHPVLETVPKIEISEKDTKGKADEIAVDKRLTTTDYAPHYVNELYRSLRTKLLLTFRGAKTKTLVVTSLNMGEGKSLTTANIAITMAQQQLSTVLIDADLRRGVQHNTFALHKVPGVTNLVLPGEAMTEQAVSAMLQQTHVPNLKLLSCGQNMPNPLELISSARFENMLNVLKRLYDVVIIDSPPLAVASDGVVLSGMMDKTLVVVESGKTNVIDLRNKIEEYPGFDEKI
ncbi:MAG: GumC family protein, partial [Chitinivibrionales bacterium]